MAQIKRRTFVSGAVGAAGITSLGWGAGPARASGSEDVVLVSSGRPTVSLKWWGGEPAKFAAEELRDYLEAMTGVRVRVHPARLLGAAPDHALHGVVARPGASDRVPADWLATADAQLADSRGDAYTVVAEDDRVVLAGTEARASLYAAYELLEQLGVRFFAPQFAFYAGHSEHVPQQEVVAVEPQQLLRQPDWDLRRRYVEEGFSHTSSNLPQLIDWMAKQRLNVLVYPFDYIAVGTTVYDEMRESVVPAMRKRGLTIEVGGHGYDSFLRPEDYPEYYTRSETLFDIDNDAALQAYVDEVVDYLDDRPEIEIFDCWAPDQWTFPEEILDAFGGEATNVEAHVVNTLTAALAERMPHVRVERIAYASTLDPPSPEYALDPRVIVDFAPINRNYKGSLDDPDYPANLDHATILQEWRSSFDGDLGMYEYYRRYRWRSAPAHPLATIAADVRFEATVPVQGTGMYTEPADWVTYELVQLVLARLSWHTGLDVDAYVDAYLDDRFGSAASALDAYYRNTANDPDAYSGLDGVSQGLTDYHRARQALEQGHSVAETDASRHVIERLTWNLDIAIADLELTRAELAEPEQEAECKQHLRELFERHRFDGAALWCNYAARRWMPMSNAFRRVVADAYRSPAYGFVDEAVTVVAGATATAQVCAQDVDYSGHDVDWSIEEAGEVSVAPAQGSLSVQGSGVASQTVTLSVPEGTEPGTYPVDLTFATSDGVELPAGTMTVTVTAE